MSISLIGVRNVLCNCTLRAWLFLSTLCILLFSYNERLLLLLDLFEKVRFKQVLALDEGLEEGLAFLG